MEYAVCDLQMLRGKDGEYVLKEFAVFHIAEGAFEHKEATFLPPYPKELIREKYLKQNCYTEAHLHGLGWNAGYSPYDKVPKTLQNMTQDYACLYVKGTEKQKILEYLIPSKQIINVESLGCPALRKLPLVWASCPNDVIRCHSCTNCAVRNAKRVGFWLQSYLYSI